MAQLQLCIFHYHLLPGGVTDVIMGWLRIFAGCSDSILPQYRDREISLRICCGDPENVAPLRQQWDDFAQTLPLGMQQRLVSVEFLVDSELGYKGLPQGEAFRGLSAEQKAVYWQGCVDSLAEHLLSQYTADGSDSLWWVHNYHLGKNIAYTKALLQIIEGRFSARFAPNLILRAGSVKFLLHIHDFPECGRFARYSELLQSREWLAGDACRPAGLYPAARNVCYATINKRDYKILQEAGLPEERLFFLPNPLEFPDLPSPSSGSSFPSGTEPASPASPASMAVSGAETEAELRTLFAKTFGLTHPERALALYPVRCIRRKNVLELQLLNVLAGGPWNLVCTLPGRSEAERPYSELVRQLYREGVIQGLCDVGLHLEEQNWSFEMLCRAASLIGSGSVMEGFGFTYFNPMYRGKTLVARKLDVLQGFEHCFRPELALFYRELKIPLRYGSHWDNQGNNSDNNGENGDRDVNLTLMYRELRAKYQEYVARVPDALRSGIEEELQWHMPPEPPDSLDFAFFTVKQQCGILRHLHRESREYREQGSDRSGGAGLLAACRAANRELLEQLGNLMADTGSVPSVRLAEARRQSREQITAEFAPQHLAGILRRACAAVFTEAGPVLGSGQEYSQGYRQAEEIGYNVLRAFSKLEYNYAILWDNIGPKVSEVSEAGPEAENRDGKSRTPHS
ncbi:hypothetical protein P0082_06740 [Candidatus Haliotispira prima]|uniref:Glycoside hydrolase family 57 N-terminal domain-containing protein n=1 Tax=Candidatus Haliotispira prima TaxID=3034016 RepID=A0ABY8ME00_9SPIO|nr:hypothetical protein P0082_06740 [Candidatus Haliotispira prima]